MIWYILRTFQPLVNNDACFVSFLLLFYFFFYNLMAWLLCDFKIKIKIETSFYFQIKCCYTILLLFYYFFKNDFVQFTLFSFSSFLLTHFTFKIYGADNQIKKFVWWSDQFTPFFFFFIAYFTLEKEANKTSTKKKTKCWNCQCFDNYINVILATIMYCHLIKSIRPTFR